VRESLFSVIRFCWRSAGLRNGPPGSSEAFWRCRQAEARILEQRLILYTIAVKRICRPAFASPRHRMRRRP
jgi:hypothetical protein